MDRWVKYQGRVALGGALSGQPDGSMRAIAAIHIASSTPIAMTTIVLNFTGLIRPPQEKNIAAGPLIPGREANIEAEFMRFSRAF